MSMFSFPDAMTPETFMKPMPDATRWMPELPAALPMPPLMVHPVAASAAATAVGLGMASHMSGLLWGSLEGAMNVSRHFGMPLSADLADVPMKLWAFEWSKTEDAPAADSQVAGLTDAANAGDEWAGAAEAAPDAVAESAEPPLAVAGIAAQMLQPEEFRRPPEMARPESPDDLKLISGIGPKLEQVLNGLGIWTFAQIEALDAAEAAWIDDYLQFRGRVERDGWQTQAASLAKPAG